ncbi:uncharacterized protein LTR77_004287 [Saxophila tyrrhenica]|uniref:Uncharacterized protein n=1 Tax=Saxophila tyrrhenica TaxID=1690608 RepID=A0AAV9PG97_9PEZI|nr:hypothetical protein LTR77_004287 [Saxophila tyrrhenica]
MTQDEVNAAYANVPGADLNGPQVTGSGNFMEKYAAEREKRMNAKGVGQYIDLVGSDKYGKFVEDPWVEANTPVNEPVPDGGRSKFLIGEHLHKKHFDGKAEVEFGIQQLVQGSAVSYML